MPGCLQRLYDIAGHTQCIRRDQTDAKARKQREQFGERVHCSPITQIADHGDAQSVETPVATRELGANSVEIQQRLTGVLVGTIPAIDDGHTTGMGKLRNRARLGVAHDDNIGVTAQHPGGIVEGLALGNG